MDASTVINLVNGGALETVLASTTRTFLIGPIVLDECAGDRPRLEALVSEGVLQLVDEESIRATAYLQFLQKYRLGPGETECLTFAQGMDCAVCSDDSAARHAFTAEIGGDRLTGSIGLLREAVHSGLLTSVQASGHYEQMLTRGAFLPIIDHNFFEE